jgi:hypothetical protein
MPGKNNIFNKQKKLDRNIIIWTLYTCQDSSWTSSAPYLLYQRTDSMQMLQTVTYLFDMRVGLPSVPNPANLRHL